MYDYRVLEVVRVVDGDTVDLKLDVGFRLSTVLRFRLLRVDTPEVGQPGWRECTDFTGAWLKKDGLVAHTVKTDHFGRWLADVFDADGHSLSDDLRELMRRGGFTKDSKYNRE